MGFLSRILKTPDSDPDEIEDEFQAEESGLLMSSTPPEESADAPPEAGVGGSPVAPAEAEAGGSPAATADIPPGAESVPPTEQGEAESQPPSEPDKPPETGGDAGGSEPVTESQPPANGASADLSDDPLALFRSTAGRSQHADAIQEDLAEVSMMDLLAEARSVRDTLTERAQGATPIERAEQEAA